MRSVVAWSFPGTSNLRSAQTLDSRDSLRMNRSCFVAAVCWEAWLFMFRVCVCSGVLIELTTIAHGQATF
jgi:hypothetical protein